MDVRLRLDDFKEATINRSAIVDDNARRSSCKTGRHYEPDTFRRRVTYKIESCGVTLYGDRYAVEFNRKYRTACSLEPPTPIWSESASPTVDLTMLNSPAERPVGSPGLGLGVG